MLALPWVSNLMLTTKKLRGPTPPALTYKQLTRLSSQINILCLEHLKLTLFSHKFAATSKMAGRAGSQMNCCCSPESNRSFLAGTGTGLCTVVPATHCRRVLTMANKGHLGIVKFKQRCRGLAWWPGINKEIEAVVKDCFACQHQASLPLQPLSWPSHPWEHLKLDFFR